LVCVDELREAMLKGEQVFSIVSIVGPLGTGKTHLALHMKTLKDKFECTYVDLTRIEPKDLKSIYLAIVKDLRNDFFQELHDGLILKLGERAEEGNDYAMKVLKIGLFDRILGRRTSSIAENIINKRRTMDLSYLKGTLPELAENCALESALKILSEDSLWFLEVKDFNDALEKLKGLATITCIIGKVLLIEIDEISDAKPLMDGIKAVINEKLPGVVLVAILRSGVETEISEADPSLYDRLRKAPFTCSLSQPDDPDQIWDIIREYLKFHSAIITEEDGEALRNLIRYAYNEVGMTEIRELLALIREALELAKGSNRIGDEHLIGAIIRIRPNAELKGSIMRIPIPDYLRIIRTSMKTLEETSYGLTRAIRDLGRYLFIRDAIFYTHGASRRIDTPGGSKSFRLADAYFEEKDGRKIAVNVKLTEKECLTKQEIDDTLEIVEHGRVDQAIVLTNAAYSRDLEHPKLVFEKMADRRSIADYLYFSEKFQAGRLTENDEKNAIRLAKCLGVGYWG
jgi:hypothetical protein